MLAYETPIDDTKTPRVYAERLASYLNDPQAIYIACRRQFGRDHPDVPKPSSILNMIEMRKAKRRLAVVEDDHDDGSHWGYKVSPAVQEKAETEAVAFVEPILPEIKVDPVFDTMFRRDVVRKVAHAFGIPYEEIVGERRFRSLITARTVAAKLLKERGLSYPQIGRHLGGRDHCTAINLVKQFANYAKRSPEAMEIYEAHRKPVVGGEEAA